MDENVGGSISEWNEGNLKNLRLHEAQTYINYGKIEPFSRTEDGTNWRFTFWKAGIDILYGEGESKYSKEEGVEVEKLKDTVDKIIELHKPFNIETKGNYQGSKKVFRPIKNNQNKIKKFLSIYEKKVKKLNDIHGLSTRNKEDYDITKSVVSN